MSETSKPLVGISACLLGEKVRFDGGHKNDTYVRNVLGEHFDWMPVCPELEAGLGVPREAIRLVDRGDSVRVEGRSSGTDHTPALEAHADRRVEELSAAPLRGYLFKKGSPSCGLFGVKIYPGNGKGVPRGGRGLFAARLSEAFPHLPIEEEGRLTDAVLRENWVERVFAYDALRALLDRPRWTIGDLVKFHTRYKLTLMAHSPEKYREIGRLVAGAKALERRELATRYGTLFMETLVKRASPARHVNVLQHMLGHLRGKVSPAAREDLRASIENYRSGSVPLIVPVTLIAHYVRLAEISYLADQTYLEPWPKSLGLRSRL